VEEGLAAEDAEEAVAVLPGVVDETVQLVIGRTVPSSRTQAAQLERMRNAASTLRRANSETEADDDPSPTRRVMA
jgi:hypothetical protein